MTLPGEGEARSAIAALRPTGLTVAVAESLTGGLVVGALTTVPGGSAVVRGGVVAYATDLKASVLGVDADLLAERGPVDAVVARQMADGVAHALGADVGLATTGVAGPDPQGAAPVGRVHIALAGAGGGRSLVLDLDGSREEIRAETVRRVLVLLAQAARAAAPSGPRGTVEGSRRPEGGHP